MVSLRSSVQELWGWEIRKRIESRNAEILIDVPGAAPYEGLHASSLALVGPQSSEELPLAVNLLLPETRVSSIFAGIRTAIVVASRLAEQTGRQLRIWSFDLRRPLSRRSRAEFAQRVFEISGVWPLGVLSIQDLDLPISSRDLWIPTYWTTAHALDVACIAGRIDSKRCVYLVQDYEPEFFPGSAESTLARSTYSAGFSMIVNSLPVAELIREREPVEVDTELVLEPQLDLDRLRSAAEDRTSVEGEVRVGFYGRPSKPRNSFAIGRSSLKIAGHELRRIGLEIDVRSVGERHSQFLIGQRAPVESLGNLGWEGYYQFLSSVEVMFSLQETPHPSHIPLDAACAGALAVINDFGESRRNLSASILTAGPSVRSIAARIVEACQLAADGELPEPDLRLARRLGNPLGDVVSRAVEVVNG